MTLGKPTTIMALDVGERRIGVALASNLARLPRPFVTLENSAGIFDELKRMITDLDVGVVVVGRPRNLNGKTTAQTETVESFAADLEKKLRLPVCLQDEAVTSRQAEAELKAKGKKFDKADIDALAATYILEDYLHEQVEARHA